LKDINSNIELLEELRQCPEFSHLKDDELMEVLNTINIWCSVIVDSKMEQILDMNEIKK
jgi:hypothetical protein